MIICMIGLLGVALSKQKKGTRRGLWRLYFDSIPTKFQLQQVHYNAPNYKKEAYGDGIKRKGDKIRMGY